MRKRMKLRGEVRRRGSRRRIKIWRGRISRMRS